VGIIVIVVLSLLILIVLANDTDAAATPVIQITLPDKDKHTRSAALGFMKWNKVHFRVDRFGNANQPLVISCFCYGQPPHCDGMGI
jgi:hypothetical protein